MAHETSDNQNTQQETAATEAATPRARVRILDADGNVKEDLTGDDRVMGQPEEFLRSLAQPVDEPHMIYGSAWQQVDDEHPIETGTPSYRIAYKTLRIIPHPSIEMLWPNLRVRITNDRINRGGMTATEAIPGRGPRRSVIPEYGKIYDRDSQAPFYIRGLNNATIGIGGWEEDIDAANFVEITYKIEDTDTKDYDALLRRGRRAIARLKTLLEFKFGPRLLAMPILEEVGESFEDWHWNRRIHTGSLFVESQAAMRQLEPREITDELAPLIEQGQNLGEDERRRLTLACLWYWRADADNEPTTKLISWWLVAETLEMPDTNVVHIRRRLDEILGEGESYWRLLVGRLFGVRSRIAHGNEGEVSDDDLKRAESLARVLLAARLLGTVPEPLSEAIRTAAEEQNRAT